MYRNAPPGSRDNGCRSSRWIAIFDVQIVFIHQGDPDAGNGSNDSALQRGDEAFPRGSRVIELQPGVLADSPPPIPGHP
jgi:hypothetical protein